MISFYLNDVEIPGVNPDFFIDWIRESIDKEGFTCGALNIIFVCDESLLEMNRKYLNHDYYTDIISFDYSENMIIAGDLFISVDRVMANSVEFDVSFLNELLRVIIHGVLHLCGYLDKDPSDVIIMRSKEDMYIRDYVSRET